MSLAFVFPGQGSQQIGMLSALAKTSPVIESTFAEASAVLGYDLWRRCQEGTLFPWLAGRLRVLCELPELLAHRRRLREITVTENVADWLVDERPILPWTAATRRASVEVIASTHAIKV